MTAPGQTTAVVNDPPPEPFTFTWKNIRRLGPAGLMGVASLVLPPIGAAILLSQLNRFAEPLREHSWGPVLAMLLFGLLGGFALLPTAVLAIFAGWAFHFWVGLLVATLGFTFAAAIGFLTARHFSGRTLLEFVGQNPRWHAVHQAMLGGSTAKTFLIVFLLRVPSVPPFAMTSVALAALRVRFGLFLLATFLGVIPRTAAYVFMASKAEKLDYNVAGGWQMLAIWGGLTIAIIGLLTYFARRALAGITATSSAADKVSPS